MHLCWRPLHSTSTWLHRNPLCRIQSGQYLRPTWPMGRKRTSAAAAADAQPADPSNGAAKAGPPSFYLVKSEPDEFSIDALEAKPESTSHWDGVRNAQARNIMKGMKVGERALYYHSSCKVPGPVGIVEVVREAYPDHTAWEAGGKYFDAKSTPENPKWFMVDFRLVRRLSRQITLEELKGHKDGALAGMALFTAPRLSVQPVSEQHWDFILGLEDQAPAEGQTGKKAGKGRHVKQAEQPDKARKAGKAGKAGKAEQAEEGKQPKKATQQAKEAKHEEEAKQAEQQPSKRRKQAGKQKGEQPG